MKIKFYFTCLWVVLISVIELDAQDSIKYEHTTVDLIATKLGFSGSKSPQEHLDRLSQPLGVLTTSTAHVQANGPDLLSTLLIKGMGSRHTAILWNGWNLQSPVNGVLDLSLLAGSNNGFTIRSQPASSIIGNGAAAGVIALNSYLLDSLNTIQLDLMQNSFGNLDIGSHYRYSNDKFDINLSGRWTKHKNEFEFDNFGTIKKQENALKDGFDIEINTKYHLDDNQHIKAAVWLQKSDRKIPATKTTIYKNEQQEDANIRGHIAWNYQNDRHQSSVRIGYINEYIAYQSDIVKKSTSLAKTYLVEGLTNLKIRNNDVYLGLQLTSIDVSLRSLDDLNGYDKLVGRDQIATWSGIKFPLGSNFVFDGGVRLEYINMDQTIFTYHVSPSIDLFDMLWTYRVSSVFQQATINDLYWPQGGNPNLQNESGLMQEFSIKKETNYNRNKLIFNMSFFSYHSDDWIIWSPNTSGIWSPENRRNVWSRGLETGMTFSTAFNTDHKYKSHISYAYTKATVMQDSDDRVVGKQIIYVPRHKVNWINEYQIKSWHAHVTGTWVGKRYVTNDNTEGVDGYLVLTAGISKKLNLKGVFSTLSISLDNLLNNEYEVVKFYATPLRSITFAATFKI